MKRPKKSETPSAILAVLLKVPFESAEIVRDSPNSAVARIGQDEVLVRVVLDPLSRFAEKVVAPLRFFIKSADFASNEVELQISGYGDTPNDAVVDGIGELGCSIAALLAFRYPFLLEKPHVELQTFETTIDDRRCSVAIARMNKHFAIGRGPDSGLTAAFLEEADAEPLTVRLLRHGLGPIASQSTSVISTFVLAGPARIGEVVINGTERKDLSEFLTPAPRLCVGPSMARVREVALLVPNL
jgi:hypothetical protein